MQSRDWKGEDRIFELRNKRQENLFPSRIKMEGNKKRKREEISKFDAEPFLRAGVRLARVLRGHFGPFREIEREK